MDDSVTEQGAFSLIRWRREATRDEPKNVGIILVGSDSKEAMIRTLPISSVSHRLADQGLLDDLIEGLRTRLIGTPVSDSLLTELHGNLQRSVVVTEPRPVAVTKIDETLDALFKAYCARRGAPRSMTKSVVLDRVVVALRRQGYHVRRGVTKEGFLFDAVVQNGGPSETALEVLSFAVARKDWSPVLHDAAHFLYALERVDVDGTAVLEPPREASGPTPFTRVRKWLKDAQVDWVEPADLASEQAKIF
jgi:hypothetical protein